MDLSVFWTAVEPAALVWIKHSVAENERAVDCRLPFVTNI